MPPKSALVAAYKAIDVDGSGKLSAKELCNIFKQVDQYKGLSDAKLKECAVVSSYMIIFFLQIIYF